MRPGERCVAASSGIGAMRAPCAGARARSVKGVTSMYAMSSGVIAVPEGGSGPARRALLTRFEDRLVVRPELTRRLISYQGNKGHPGLRWLRYKAGRYQAIVDEAYTIAINVSILARPERRALPAGWSRTRRAAACFNPRPARRPGAPQLRRRGLPCSSKFQSSPRARRPGATDRRGARIQARLGVSILARPEGRALPSDLVVLLAGHGVSILARPEGRALRRERGGDACLAGDVSILARPEGRALRVEVLPRHVRHPVSILARPEGRALRRCRVAARGHPRHVSILARPEGRALPATVPRCAHRHCYRFNPRPARRPGAPDRSAQCSSRGNQRFNPRPARRPGAPSSRSGCR